jgi:3-dehydroquinate synthase
VTATVQVAAPGRAYPVHVGPGLLGRADELLAPSLAGARNAAVVHARAVAGVAATVAGALGRLGLTVHRAEVPDGEAAKRLDVVAGLYERFAAVPMHRTDPVVAVGGGATTDVGGFAAATWLRGVPLVNVPTTVLGMVDAAVGGKTGVDLPAGKNLVGAFHQPVAVLADLDTLASLPAAELRSGLAEVVKAGLIAEPPLAGRVAAAASANGLAGDRADRPAAGAVAGAVDWLAPHVEAAIRVKARVVAADEREASLREILNYGHTLGHALERLAGYEGLRHGEAISIGMVFAAHVAELAGVAKQGLADEHRALLAAVGLPTGGVPWDADAVLAAMAGDKKARGGIRLVLLREPGEPEVLPAPDRPVLVEALRAVAAPR